MYKNIFNAIYYAMWCGFSAYTWFVVGTGRNKNLLYKKTFTYVGSSTSLSYRTYTRSKKRKTQQRNKQESTP